MANVDSSVMKNVYLFLQKLDEEGIEISKAYIFGSYANDRFDQWSDIDVAIVSPQIGSDRFEERIRLTRMANQIDDRIEPLLFNTENFVDSDPLVKEIMTSGHVVA
jgi:predicted nucleotidyltransferase